MISLCNIFVRMDYYHFTFSASYAMLLNLLLCTHFIAMFTMHKSQAIHHLERRALATQKRGITAIHGINMQLLFRLLTSSIVHVISYSVFISFSLCTNKNIHTVYCMSGY